MKLIDGGQRDTEGSLIHQHSGRMKPGGTFIAATASNRGCMDTAGVLTRKLFSGRAESIAALIFLIPECLALPAEPNLGANQHLDFMLRCHTSDS